MSAIETTKLSIVIPLFNEEQGIDLLMQRLDAFIQTIEVTTEVILIDDHSTDRTSQLLREYCEKLSYLKYLRLARNSGSHVAILTGLQYSEGDCAVFLAADLQDPPELIADMLKLWQQGYDVIWAVRAQRQGTSWFSKIFSNMYYKLLNSMTNLSHPPKGADFALLDRKVIDALLVSAGSKPCLGGLIAWLGFNQTGIDYVKEARKFGKSKWTLSKKLNAFADAFVGFSYIPLRVMSYLGFFMAFLGFLYAFIVILLKLIYQTQIEGWASLMVVVLVVSGVQMVMLGILGEYLWRNLEESRGRPLFIIETKKGF